MAKKIYAVRNGRVPGIYTSWADCQKQITGFSGAEYKGFATAQEAKAFLDGKETSDNRPAGSEKYSGTEERAAVAYVDGSYDKTSGDFSYGMVVLYQGEERFFCEQLHDTELAKMHNVAGEIKGAEAAMRYALENGWKKLVIYHDYEGIAKWCTGAWQAKKEGTKAYRAFYDQASQSVDITFVKVRGHSGDKYNELADRLAKKALGIGV